MPSPRVPIAAAIRGEGCNLPPACGPGEGAACISSTDTSPALANPSPASAYTSLPAATVVPVMTQAAPKPIYRAASHTMPGPGVNRVPHNSSAPHPAPYNDRPSAIRLIRPTIDCPILTLELQSGPYHRIPRAALHTLEPAEVLFCARSTDLTALCCFANAFSIAPGPATTAGREDADRCWLGGANGCADDPRGGGGI